MGENIHCNGVVFFFFKQKTAYEIASCLVGSEMCIRDRLWRVFVRILDLWMTTNTFSWLFEQMTIITLMVMMLVLFFQYFTVWNIVNFNNSGTVNPVRLYSYSNDTIFYSKVTYKDKSFVKLMKPHSRPKLVTQTLSFTLPNQCLKTDREVSPICLYWAKLTSTKPSETIPRHKKFSKRKQGKQ